MKEKSIIQQNLKKIIGVIVVSVFAIYLYGSKLRFGGNIKAKYRKKPVVIEAFQYDGDLKDCDGNWYVPNWAVEAYEKGIMHYASESCDAFYRDSGRHSPCFSMGLCD